MREQEGSAHRRKGVRTCELPGNGNSRGGAPVGRGTPSSRKAHPLRILLTGIDGSGKSTAARDLTSAVLARGGSAIMLKTPAGRRTMNGWWDALGWAPGPRLQDFAETIVRAANALLNEVRLRGFDGVVVLDRGIPCQLALREARGIRRGVFLPWLQRVLPAPDVVAHFDVPIDVALARVAARATDSETASGLAALDAGYRRLPEFVDFTLIDADRPTEVIVAELALARTSLVQRSAGGRPTDGTLAQY
ncbi:thymidylate kinase [Arthrobacter cheniae]|uniref:Thymidylate kinase n=1 Tax=Arthrobacter cheniae TaxID=1258888 RepID=A0A3A5MFL0_9MICC|nr:AAA family ATPase [Arthrobacter cheniae]RJT83123.1 thymidylate kinase [Arthrobacter cheniae]